ncbi:MAG: cell division protein ZapE [bacterium]
MYELREASGELQRDHTQCSILPELDRISLGLNLDQQSHSFLFKKPRTLPGLYLWGGVGRGKTMLMDCLVQAIPPEFVLRVHFHEFMLGIHRRLSNFSQTQDPLPLVLKQLLTDKKLLALDEFEVLDIADAMLLDGILKALQQLGVVLVTTSNTHPSDLYALGLQRSRFLPAIALIMNSMNVIHMNDGEDHRLKYLREQQRFITPAGERANHQLTDIFHHLLSGEAFECGGHFLLHERLIPVHMKAEGISWFEFSALCEGPRSSLDYLALSRTHHTLLLSGIPEMNDENNSAAKRFISLIDVLYDQKTNLIASSEVQVRDIYQGKRLAKEFIRTTSRLIEMQSEHYIQLRLST